MRLQMRLFREWRAVRWQLKRQGFAFDYVYATAITCFFLAFLASAVVAKLSALSFFGVEVPHLFTAQHFALFPFVMLFLLVSITFYQHRVVAHRSAKNLHPILHILFMYGQTSTVQASLKTWAGQHRVHHAKGDTKVDPYSVHKFKFSNFWSYMWAHFMAFFYKSPHKEEYDRAAAKLNQQVPLADFQDKYYLPLVVGVLALNAFVVMLLCSETISWGNYGIALLFQMGIIGAVHQITWMVNSCTHTRNENNPRKSSKWSAVDRPVWTIFSLLPLGEGNQHRGHHDFASDFYNGATTRFVYDPTGWFGWSLSKIGLVELTQANPQMLYQHHFEGGVECILCKIPAKLKGKMQAAAHTMREDLNPKLDEVRQAWQDLQRARTAYIGEKNRALKEAQHQAHEKWKAVCKDVDVYVENCLHTLQQHSLSTVAID